MRILRKTTFVLLLLLAVLGGAQLRIARIRIHEPSGDRTTFRVCWPGCQPDVFSMTDSDFMCHMYDWYGLRHLGGFGSATHQKATPDVLLPASVEPGLVDEAMAIAIAQRSVATNDSWADRAIFDAKRDGTRWLVSAMRIERTNELGELQFAFGGHRLVVIEADGRVARYIRGR